MISVNVEAWGRYDQCLVSQLQTPTAGWAIYMTDAGTNLGHVAIVEHGHFSNETQYSSYG